MDATQIEQIADGAMGRLIVPPELAGESEDIRQDVVLAILQSLREDRHHLPTIAYRAGLKSMQERARVGGYDDLYASLKADGRGRRQRLKAASPAGPDTSMEARELAAKAKAHLEQLDPIKARAVKLCIMDGRTHDEAAQVLGVHRNTVARMVADGVGELRDKMGR